jgi:hypothetical protein
MIKNIGISQTIKDVVASNNKNVMGIHPSKPNKNLIHLMIPFNMQQH